MNEMVHTLPPKSTKLERAVVTACAPLGEVPVPIRSLWRIDECPAELLPHLAWAFSVDRWDEAWSDEVKRGVIKASFYIHKHKGTIAAVRRVVESLGYLIRIVEWWQTDPMGESGTFQLEVGVLNSGITEEMYEEMERLIADAKPESRHLTGLSIQMEVRAKHYMGVAAYLGDELTVYPYSPEPIVISLGAQMGIGEHSIDTLTVLPLNTAI